MDNCPPDKWRCLHHRNITETEWGWRKDQLMKVYKALQPSLVIYAAPAWQPWAVSSRIEQLERCQNKALWVVTRQLKSTKLKTLRREAGIYSNAPAAKRAKALIYEKAHRLPIDHPRRQILAAPSRHRLKRPSWRSAAHASTSHLPAELAQRPPIDSPLSCPFEDSSNWSSAGTTVLRRVLNKRAGKTTLLWIPGHHAIAGNEVADACAKQVTAITDGAPRLVS